MEIGGYFEVEFSNINLGNIHGNAIHLNIGRNCLEYIIISRKYTKIYLPFYLCSVLLEPILRNNIKYEYYSINKDLEPIDLPDVNKSECFLYINYFGLKNEYINNVLRNKQNIIIDNSQALFCKPIIGIDTFYSLRKFVGVSEGAFLYYDGISDVQLAENDLFVNNEFLYKRKNINAGNGYGDFSSNEQIFSDLPIKKMALATESFLKTYDFEKNKIIRERNFLYLEFHFNNINLLKITSRYQLSGPLCYPLLIDNEEIRNELIRNKVYVPYLWRGVTSEFESWLAKYILPLPIDHRYDTIDLYKIISIVNQFN